MDAVKGQVVTLSRRINEFLQGSVSVKLRGEGLVQGRARFVTIYFNPACQARERGGGIETL